MGFFNPPISPSDKVNQSWYYEKTTDGSKLTKLTQKEKHVKRHVWQPGIRDWVMLQSTSNDILSISWTMWPAVWLSNKNLNNLCSSFLCRKRFGFWHKTGTICDFHIPHSCCQTEGTLRVPDGTEGRRVPSSGIRVIRLFRYLLENFDNQSTKKRKRNAAYWNEVNWSAGCKRSFSLPIKVFLHLMLIVPFYISHTQLHVFLLFYPVTISHSGSSAHPVCFKDLKINY